MDDKYHADYCKLLSDVHLLHLMLRKIYVQLWFKGFQLLPSGNSKFIITFLACYGALIKPCCTLNEVANLCIVIKPGQ